MSVIAIPLLLLVRKEPEFPPDNEAHRLSLVGMSSLRTTIKQLFKNKNYVFLLVPFSCLYSIYMALGSIVSLICKEFEYTAN